jgi:hypothetical protein
MNKLALALLLAATPLLFPQTLKNEDLGIDISNKPGLFLRKISDFSKMDLKNTRAVYLGYDGKIGEWQALERGRGKTVEFDRQGNAMGGNSTEVRLRWQRSLDAEHQLAAYEWEWVGGSSSQSILVQVLELRGDAVFVTQQIEADAHGTGADAILNTTTKRLTVKALIFTEGDANCCPSMLSTVVFHWDGKQFRRAGARRVPIPKEEYLSTADRGTRLSRANR